MQVLPVLVLAYLILPTKEKQYIVRAAYEISGHKSCILFVSLSQETFSLANNSKPVIATDKAVTVFGQRTRMTHG
jgi:hypothetical protein